MEGDKDHRKMIYVVEDDQQQQHPASTIKWQDETLNNQQQRSWLHKLKSFTLFTEDRRITRTCQLMTFVGFFIVVMGSGEVGRLSTQWLWVEHSWSEQLIRPPYVPPHDYDFRVLWILFYVSIAFAGWRVSMRRQFTKLRVFAYVCLLLFNCLWVPVFFGWRQLFLALVDVVLLLMASMLTFVTFLQVEKKAGFVLLPYVIWVLFMACVTAGYWWLNYETQGFYNTKY